MATRFRYRLHPLESVVGGMLVLPATPEVIGAFIAEAEAAPDKLTTIANVMPAPLIPFVPAEYHGQPVIRGAPARVRAAYPGYTWDRLAAIERRYDPDNLFRAQPEHSACSGGTTV